MLIGMLVWSAKLWKVKDVLAQPNLADKTQERAQTETARDWKCWARSTKIPGLKGIHMDSWNSIWIHVSVVSMITAISQTAKPADRRLTEGVLPKWRKSRTNGTKAICAVPRNKIDLRFNLWIDHGKSDCHMGLTETEARETEKCLKNFVNGKDHLPASPSHDDGLSWFHMHLSSPSKFSNPPQPHRLRSSQANDYKVQQLGQIGKIAITAQAQLIRNLFVLFFILWKYLSLMFSSCFLLHFPLIGVLLVFRHSHSFSYCTRSVAFRYHVWVLGPT